MAPQRNAEVPRGSQPDHDGYGGTTFRAARSSHPRYDHPPIPRGPPPAHPANIAGFDPRGSVFNERYFDRQPTFVEAIAWSPLAEQVPLDSHPIRDIFGGEGPSVGWLLDARRDDRVPRPGPVSPEVQDELTIRLGIRQQFADVAEPGALTCRVHTAPLDLHPARGDRLRLVTPVGVRLIDAQAPTFFASKFDPAAGTELEIALDGLQLRVGALAPETTFELCQ